MELVRSLLQIRQTLGPGDVDVEGLSPRGRGNPNPLVTETVDIGSIPAWAGEPGWTISFKLPGKVYPRVGGGTMGGGASALDQHGLSPRGRGNLPRWSPPNPRWGSIPAWAGEPFWTWIYPVTLKWGSPHIWPDRRRSRFRRSSFHRRCLPAYRIVDCGVLNTSAGMPSAASRMGVEALPGAFPGKGRDRDCRKPGEIVDLTLSSGRGPGRASPQVSITSWKCAKNQVVVQRKCAESSWR